MATEVEKAIAAKNGKEVLPKHWFCVAANRAGDVFKADGDSPAGFSDILQKADVAWIDYWADDFTTEAVQVAARLGFSNLLVSTLLESTTTYQDFDTEMGFRVPAIHVTGFDVQAHPLLVLLKKNFIFTVHPMTVDRRFARLRRYSDVILRKIRQDAVIEDKVTILLIRLIDENNGRNFEYLRQIEELGDELNKQLIDTQVRRERLGTEIYLMKHALITYLNALWANVDVLHDLRYGDAEILTNDPVLLDKITHLTEDVSSHIALSEHMSEVLASGLEVMQSIYNNQLQVLNNRLAMVMTYLTIIGTAVLVPNTLATIFSNSAFSLGPEDIWWYVIVLVASTVGATYLAYWWIRKMGWLPRRPD